MKITHITERTMTHDLRIAALLLIAAVAMAACTHTSGFREEQGKVLTLAEQGYFFVGGHYTQTNDEQIMTGQMYVQYQIPQNRSQAYPVVMWHGGGQTGTNFMGTPDGRKGWADYFLERGYAVYIVD